MIGYLVGIVQDDVIVTSGGVGYVVACPHPLVEGDHTTLHVVTIVTDNAISLYGFAHLSERDLFQTLRKVTGVGPAMVMNILRDLGAGPAAAAIVSRDVTALTRVTGVGRKTAERLVNELAASPSVQALVDPEASSTAREVARTLEDMGFAVPAAAQAAAAAVSELGEVAAEADLLGAALAHVARSES